MGKATQDLINEHEAILHVLKIVDQLMSSDKAGDDEILKFGNELVYFLQIFADKCHHGKEEDFLFAEIIKEGISEEDDLIGILLQEHQKGREYISRMRASLESKDVNQFESSAILYRDLLRGHIEKENDVLFKLADELLGESQQEALFDKFENHEETVIGHGVHEELHAMIHKWEEEIAG
jgi:hemerythrin-like domain-containing protein